MMCATVWSRALHASLGATRRTASPSICQRSAVAMRKVSTLTSSQHEGICVFWHLVRSPRVASKSQKSKQAEASSHQDMRKSGAGFGCTMLYTHAYNQYDSRGGTRFTRLPQPRVLSPVRSHARGLVCSAPSCSPASERVYPLQHICHVRHGVLQHKHRLPVTQRVRLLP